MINRFSKSMLVLGVVSLLSAGATFAGNGTPKGDGSGGGKGNAKGNPDVEWNGGPANKMARMSERFGLTEDQEDAILAFYREREVEREAMRLLIQDAFGDKICAQRAANEGSFEDLLFSILDEEQWALHEEMKASREANQGNRKSRRGNGGFECPVPAEG
jgi:hypothetical protein